MSANGAGARRQYLVIVNGQAFVREALPAGLVESEDGTKALVLLPGEAVKHLPGRHDQQSHGRGGGGGASTESFPEVGRFTDVQQAERWASKTYPDAQWDFTGAHVDTINPTVAKMHEVLQQYPDALRGVNYVGTFQGPKAPDLGEAFGNNYAFFDREYGQIGINPYFYGNPNRLRVRLQVDVEQGWSPKGGEHPGYPVVHELGHAVYYRHESTPAVQEFMAASKPTKSLAKYALKSKKEAWAEGFAQATLGEPKRWDKYTKSQASILNALSVAERGGL